MQSVKKVRFFESDLTDQIGLFRTAEYSASGEKVNIVREKMLQNTTMNERFNYLNRINNNRSLGILPGFIPENIRDNCFIKHEKSRDHVTPYTFINMVPENTGGTFLFDSRFDKKSYT